MKRAALLVFAVTIARADVAQLPPPTVPTLSETLANGLTVIVQNDDSVSSVVVHVRYDGGIADEDAAHAGYSHLVEKLFFQGTVHTKAGELEQRIDAAGGFASSTTDADRVSLYEQIPAGGLELALWLEAERMAGLADGLTDAGLAAARAAIAAEVRAAYEDEPYGLVDRAVSRALWPERVDPLVVPKATRDSVRAYVRERFVPANATIAIVGHVDAARTLRLARKYFGWIPGGTRRVVQPSPVEPLHAAVSHALTDPDPKIVVAYRLNKLDAEDALALAVGARIVERTWAGHDADVQVELVRGGHGGELRITARPRPGEQLVKDTPSITYIADRLGRSDLPYDQVRAAAASLDRDLLIALEGLTYRADALASGLPIDLRRGELRSVSPEAIKRAAAYWLPKSASVTIIGEPEKR
ncbi:MAG TPA: insulinase family protein [Kofleriaceae bacterium]|nr:insulinase family protein [Kofleriaceae bacterium]